MSAAFGRYGRNRRLAKMERGPFLWENGPLFALVRHMCFVRVPERFSCSRLANGVFCVANGYTNASVASACEDNEPHRQAVFARGQASWPPRDSRHGEPRRRPPAIRACAHRQPRNALARQRPRKPYGCGTSAGNCGSFGVPMRKDSSTSHGSQPWLISTSLCTDIYM